MAADSNQGVLFTIEDKVTNDAENYGFSEKVLKAYHTKIDNNYQAAMYLFYGIHNVHRTDGTSINREIYESLNTSEIAAMLIGFAKIKLRGSFYRGKTVNYSELKEKKAEEVIPELIKAGKNYNGTRTMADRGFTSHDMSEKSLMKRVSSLSREAKEGFETLSRRKMAVSSSQNSIDYDFIEPNVDGKLDQAGAKAYLNHFLGKISAVYKRNYRSV